MDSTGQYTGIFIGIVSQRNIVILILRVSSSQSERNIFTQFLIQIQTGRKTTDTIILDNSFLVHIVDRSQITGFLRTTIHRKIVLLRISVTHYRIKPISTTCQQYFIIIESRFILSGRSIRFLHISFINPHSIQLQPLLVLLIIHIHIHTSIKHLIIRTGYLHRSHTGISHSGLLTLTAFCCNQNNSMTGTCSINSRRSGIFQN